MYQTPQRGDVFFADFDPVFGREIGGHKSRPAVVVSVDDIHRSRIVVVVPGTEAHGKGHRPPSWVHGRRAATTHWAKRRISCAIRCGRSTSGGCNPTARWDSCLPPT